MRFNYNDGGRKAVGYIGGVNDCVSRAIAIALNMHYGTVHEGLRKIEPEIEREGVNTHSPAFIVHMDLLGFAWVPALGKTYVPDLPKRGRLVIDVPKHYTTLIDGELHDVINCGGSEVRGYWVYKPDGLFDVYRGDTKLNKYQMNKTQALTMRRLYQTNYGEKIFVI